MPQPDSVESMTAQGVEVAVELGLAPPGGRILMIAGTPFGAKDYRRSIFPQIVGAVMAGVALYTLPTSPVIASRRAEICPR